MPARRRLYAMPFGALLLAAIACNDSSWGFSTAPTGKDLPQPCQPSAIIVGVQLSPDTLTMRAGEQLLITVNLTLFSSTPPFSNPSTSKCVEELRWRSSDYSVVMGATGQVIALAEGTAWLTAYSASTADSVFVNVTK